MGKASALKQELAKSFAKSRSATIPRMLLTGVGLLLAVVVIAMAISFGFQGSPKTDATAMTAQPAVTIPAQSVASDQKSKPDTSFGSGTKANKTDRKNGSLEAPVPLFANPINLFNRRDLNGWTKTNASLTKNASANIWNADPATNMIYSAGGDWMDLRTNGQYLNFQLEMSWRFTPGSMPSPNGSGIMVRAKGLDSMGHNPRGLEIDIRPNESKTENGIILGKGSIIAYETPLANQTGSVDGFTKRNLGLIKSVPDGQPDSWTTCRIICLNDRIQVFMNGIKVNEAWGAEQVPGQIVLRSQNTAVQFKDMMLSEAK